MLLNFLVLALQAQDRICLQDKTITSLKILEVNSDNIKYKPLDNLDGPLHTIEKYKVLKIEYANHKVEVFNEPIQSNKNSNSIDSNAAKKTIATDTVQNNAAVKPIQAINAENTSNDSMYEEGMKDARKYFTGKAAFTANLCSGLFLNVYGLILTGICIPLTIPAKNLEFPSIEKMRNNSYSAGYRIQAQRTKKKQSWKGFLIGAGISTVAGIASFAVITSR